MAKEFIKKDTIKHFDDEKSSTLCYEAVYGENGVKYKGRIFSNYKPFINYLRLAQKAANLKRSIEAQYDVIDRNNDYRLSTWLTIKVLTKKLESLSAYSNKTVWATILYKEEDLRYWASVEGKFKNDFGKICYLFVIIVNSINEVQKMVKAKENQLTSAVEIPPEIEDISNKTNQNKDISKWLEEDET